MNCYSFFFALTTISLISWSPATLAGPITETGLTPGTRVVDLTHPLQVGIPYFPGGVPFQIEAVALLEKDGYYANRLTMGEHMGTHMDAPAHFARERWTVDSIPPERFFASLAVIDVRGKVRANPDYRLSVPDIQGWEHAYGRLPRGAVVVMWTGWEAHWLDGARYRNQDHRGTMHFPGFSPAAADFLLTKRDIAGIGIDTLSLDYGPSHDFGVHHKMLGASKYMLENLASLDKVPAHGATLVVLPLRIAAGSGSPVRALALVGK